MKLEWKIKIRNIIGFEDLYTININGKVFGKKRQKYLEPHKINDYLTVNLCKNGKKKGFLIHRLVALHFKPNPENKPEIDHIDRNRVNNNIDNLRWVNKSEQNMNRGMMSNNTSGFTGVYFNKPTGKWQAKICVHGKEKHLGLFDTPEEASAVREASAKEHYGEFNPN